LIGDFGIGDDAREQVGELIATERRPSRANVLPRGGFRRARVRFVFQQMIWRVDADFTTERQRRGIECDDRAFAERRIVNDRVAVCLCKSPDDCAAHLVPREDFASGSETLRRDGEQHALLRFA